MKYLCLIAAFVVSQVNAAFASPVSSNDNEERLRVMLQGQDSAQLAELVTQAGGEITHNLPIINAIGAAVSRQQLEQIAASPLITRSIDDLSMDAEPEDVVAPNGKTCEVRGAIELELTTRTIRWRLYNKRTTPASLEGLIVAWPPKWGKIRKASLGPHTIDSSLLSPGTGYEMHLEIPGDRRPSMGQREDLVLEFDNPENVSALQHEFLLEARFAGGCSTELIPGYPDNGENFHYASVVGADQLHTRGVTGSGVTVAVLDSGLWEHELLARNTRGEARVLARYDAIRDQLTDEAFDESGHGTHMTSVLAHSGKVRRNGVPTGSYQGIAPDVNLVAVKAFNTQGQGEMLDIVRAVQWVVNNREKYGIQVLNLSFASRPRWNYWLDPINQAIMRAWAAGITVVAASGNEGPDPMTVGSPGNLPYIITVGAVTDSWTPLDRDDDYIPDFSSRGPTPSAHIKPDLVAPGGHITGLTRPGATLMEEHPEYLLSSGDFVMTGSSQASAVVAGVAALLLQLEPDLTPDDIKCKLLGSAEPAINGDGLLAYSPFQQGHGYVSATRAITLGQRNCGNQDLDLASEIAGQEHFQGPAIVDDQGDVSLPGLEEMLSPIPAAKGRSSTRKWGVKAHIERDSFQPEGAPNANSPFDWGLIYQQEKATIEALAR